MAQLESGSLYSSPRLFGSLALALDTIDLARLGNMVPGNNVPRTMIGARRYQKIRSMWADAVNGPTLLDCVSGLSVVPLAMPGPNRRGRGARGRGTRRNDDTRHGVGRGVGREVRRWGIHGKTSFENLLRSH